MAVCGVSAGVEHDHIITGEIEVKCTLDSEHEASEHRDYSHEECCGEIVCWQAPK